jgi:molecular chaperone DnaK (HSP70)
MTGIGFAMISFDHPTSRAFVYEFDQASKTPSVILLNNANKRPVAFGAEAISRIKSSSDSNFLHEHTLIKSFKLRLNDDDDEIVDGFTATAAATIVLREMLTIIMNEVERVRPGTTQDQIRWVFTVPATWNEKAKSRTIKAIVDAGYVEASEADNDDHLLIIHEPEAAAVCCIQNMVQNAPMTETTDNDPFAAPGPPIKEGSVVLIIDAGGGTIDITVHKVEKGLLREKTVRGGGKFGSELLDKGFWDLLDNEFGKDLMDDYKENHKVHYFNLGEEWSKRKVLIRDAAKNVSITIDRELIDKVSSIKGSSYNRIRATQQTFKMNAEEVTLIYAGVLDKVMELIKDQVEQVRMLPGFEDINYTYVVGGFGASQVLQNRIKSEFGSDLGTIICPIAPEVSIMCGSAILGINSEFIKARRSNMTYGIETTRPYHLGEIQGAKTECIRGVFHYIGVLDKYVTRGMEVFPGIPVTKEYPITDPDQTELEIVLYGSPHKDTRFITDFECVKIGNGLKISFPKSNGARSIKVSFYFGRGSLKIIATGPTGEKLEVSEHFSSR